MVQNEHGGGQADRLAGGQADGQTDSADQRTHDDQASSTSNCRLNNTG